MHDSLQKTTFHFLLLYFFKAYLPFLQGTETNNWYASWNLHRFTKIQFPKKLRRKHILNISWSILRSDWDMFRVVCQPPKQRKSVWIIQIGPRETEIRQSGCFDGCQDGERVARWRWLSRWQQSWLASTTTNNVIHCQIFSFFFVPFWLNNKWTKMIKNDYNDVDISGCYSANLALIFKQIFKPCPSCSGLPSLFYGLSL